MLKNDKIKNDCMQSKPTPKSLTSKQLQVIALLINGDSYSQISNVLKINKCTLTRWKNDELFIQTLETEKQRMFNKSLELIQKNLDSAINVITDIMVNNDVNIFARLQASQTIINTALKIDERNNIVKKLDEIDKNIKISINANIQNNNIDYILND